jgi:protein-S-isoprenylcysteine O-methyltransferase Ste14
MAVGLAVRMYYQAQFRAVRRDAPRGSEFHYYVVVGGFLTVFVYAFTTWLDFAHLPIPAVVRWAGVALGVAGLALLVACHRALGRNWSGVVQLASEHALVTHGPYRYIRHPMYTSFFLSAIASALLTANFVVGVAALGSVTLMYVSRVADEERMMLQAFGDAYTEHKVKTGRLLPKIGR